MNIEDLHLDHVLKILVLVVSASSFIISMKALSHRKATSEASVSDMIIEQKNKIFNTAISLYTKDVDDKLLRKTLSVEYSHLFYVYNFACYQYYSNILRKKDFDNIYKDDIKKDIKTAVKNYDNIKLDDYKYLKKYVLDTEEK